jgi:hypothetical protein
MNKTTHPIEPEELMAYLDGELSTDREAAAVQHLSECQECQGVVASLRGVSGSLDTWKLGQPDSEIPTLIAEALERTKLQTRNKSADERRTWRPFFTQPWATAALAAVAISVYFGTVSLKRRKPIEVQSKQAVELIAPDDTRLISSPAAGGGGGGGNRDKLQASRTRLSASVSGAAESLPETKLPVTNGPMIIRTAQLSLITKEFDSARSALETILKRHRGYVGELKVGGSSGSGRTLNATLRVPADQLDASLAELKTLGRVESELQSGQDVTSQYVDLQARLGNARNTEQRLTDLLRQRTGKLSDVLEVEQEVDRVRGEIEQMEAERKTMSNQVSFATLNATITEDYKAQLQVVPPSTSTRLSNAAVEGYKSMVDGIVSLMLFLLEDGPTLLLWGAVLFFPARWAWKRVRHSFAH